MKVPDRTKATNPTGDVDAVLQKLGLPQEFFDDTFPVSAPRMLLLLFPIIKDWGSNSVL